MTTRKTILIPVDVNDAVPLPADWFSRTRKISPGLVAAAESARQQSQSEPDNDEASLQPLNPGERL